MARYATGVYAQAICDKCGLSYPYLELRPEWNGVRSCPECWDIKHPSLSPVTAFDGEALRFSRAGANEREDARAVILNGVTIASLLGTDGSKLVRADTILTETGLEITSALGTETVVLAATPSGLEITSALGTISIFTGVIITPTGFAITTSLGSESLIVSSTVVETGFAITTSLGSESLRSDTILSATGVQTTSALGNETPQAAAIETGFEITTALGSESIDRDGWGQDEWGYQTWGH